MPSALQEKRTKREATMKRETNETTVQRRDKQRAEDVRALEKVTREVVEAEHLLAAKREELAALRERLLAGVTRARRKPAVPARILAAARVVADASRPLSRADVAAALRITPSNAGMRLALAVERNLIERAERGLYRGIGRGTANGAAAVVTVAPM